MFAKLLEGIAPIDWFALVIFFAGWFVYGYYADYRTRGRSALRGATHQYRLGWGRRMVNRENRIVDSSLIGNLVQRESFYASTTTYVIAGLIAVAGLCPRTTSSPSRWSSWPCSGVATSILPRCAR